MKTSAQEIFLQANQCYAQKEFKDAENLYKKIPQKSAAVWYNLGNCAYKNGNNLEALVYWKRASKLGDRSVCNNCNYNSTVVANKLNISGKPAAAILPVGPLPLQILFFCIFSVFLVTNRKLWRAKRFIMLGILGICVLATGMITYASYRSSIAKTALIMRDESTLYAGPDSSYHQVAQIPLGNEVIVMTRKAGWSKVQWAKTIGWIQDNKIEII